MPSQRHGELDRSPEAISTEMIQLCIDTLTSDAVPPEEVLGLVNPTKNRHATCSPFILELIE